MTITIPPCLTCGKRSPLKSRGVCRGKCYSDIYLSVKRGETTWAKEEAAGRVLAPDRKSPLVRMAK